jgi:ureidoglycolate hydrolase
MGKVIRLTESELTSIIKRVISENQREQMRYANRSSRRRYSRLNEEELNEMFGFKEKIMSAIDKAKSIAAKVTAKLRDEFDDEEAQEGLDTLKDEAGFSNFGKVASALESGTQEISDREAEKLKQMADSEPSGEMAEGFWADTGKRWLARFLGIIGIPSGVAAGIIGMGAMGYNTWGGSPFLMRMHDLIDAAVGSAGGPLSALTFMISLASIIFVAANWNAGKRGGR